MTNVFKSVKEISFDDFKWIDARYSLQDDNEGKEKYLKSHVSGAVHWDLTEDLSDMTKNDGRQPMPDKQALVELFRRSGLNLDDSIIVYDDGGSPFAARAWWFLRYAGFKHAFISIEGFEEIKKAGLPVDNQFMEPKKSNIEPQWNEAIYASREFVESVVQKEVKNTLIDARAAKRYRGETEPLDRIGGHIPGALNFSWDQLKKDGTFNLDDAIKEKLMELAKPTEEVTVYCGSGVTASPLYAMLAHFGYENVRLYVGSYSDWVSKEDAEVGQGDAGV